MNCVPRATQICIAVVLSVALADPTATQAQQPYKKPPQDVIDILDAPPTPSAILSPRRDAMLLVEYEAYPSIELLARPFLRLGGLRVDPARGSRQHVRQYTGIVIVDLRRGTRTRVPLPAGARIQLPVWSHDGRRFAFARDLEDRVELWVADAATGGARPVEGVRLNDVLGAPFEWIGTGDRLLVRTVPVDRGSAPATPRLPVGPVVQETSGKRSRMATYRDLLENAHDEDLFEHYAKTQLALVDLGAAGESAGGRAQGAAGESAGGRNAGVADESAATGVSGAVRSSRLGAPGLYTGVDFSPDGQYVLATRLQRPFSYRVPYYYFTRTIEVWAADGEPVGSVAVLPVSDEVPPQGVTKGPRDVQWQPLVPAALVWAEAGDGGDPRAKVPHRDRLMALALAAALPAGSGAGGASTGVAARGASPGPAGASVDLRARARELLRLEERFEGIDWTGRPQQGLVSEYDRDRRWNTTWFVDLGAPATSRKKVFDLSANDSYHDPGNPVSVMRPDGQSVLLQDGDWIYLAGGGATESGDQPFLDRMNLKTLKKERLWRSGEAGLESFLGFAPGDTRKSILTNRQSRTEPPNWFLVELKSGKRTRLTDFQDPAPQITGIEKRLLRYHRADGVPLSGFLYLPPHYQPGTRLPLVMWAYPLEFSDAGTAGQVRGSPNTFTRLMGDSPLFFLTQGYAVLDDATMPVIGDPETMNDAYVEQIVAAAKAAIDTLDAMGIIDRDRACIAGHSYGAFMAANLLAHSDLFAAGIARSGAYNRTLTPFGFQAERRSYWEATDIYTRISPFTYADKIDEPLLLVHGELDNNSGTFPIQSERLFQAIQGNGGTSRFVLLPFESHGYRSRESVLQVLAEMFEWCDRYVKNRPAAAGAR